MPSKLSKATRALPSIPKELIDQFVTGPMSAEAVNAASLAFKKALIERALGAELGHHLDAARSRWTGQGGAAFTALGEAWSARQRVIVGALDGFAAALRSTEHDNTTTDDTQAAAFGRAQQRLG